MKVYGVIGANYGDEGKGMVSAHIRHHVGPRGTVTVLTNGGAQRGHTVASRDGRRFVFHHLGASMPGDDNVTYCPRRFVLNPMVLMQDIRDYQASWSRAVPTVFVNPYCMVTTPYDMMACQVEELLAKEGSRWGSTGMGVWHTRHRDRYVALRASELFRWCRDGVTDQPEDRLRAIRDYWLTSYLRECAVPSEYKELFESKALVDSWMQDAVSMCTLYSECRSPFYKGTPYTAAVFENAQGLMLSEDKGRHSTSSCTRALAIMDEVRDWDGLDREVKLFYVSRTYLTRHGDGPLPRECPQEFLHTEMRDETNVWNQWQGELRYGLLDELELKLRVECDIGTAGLKPEDAVLVMTHVNEVPRRSRLEYPMPVVGVDNPYMDEDLGIVR